jgi:hypothetical protein
MVAIVVDMDLDARLHLVAATGVLETEVGGVVQGDDRGEVDLQPGAVEDDAEGATASVIEIILMLLRVSSDQELMIRRCRCAISKLTGSSTSK